MHMNQILHTLDVPLYKVGLDQSACSIACSPRLHRFPLVSNSLSKASSSIQQLILLTPSELSLYIYLRDENFRNVMGNLTYILTSCPEIRVLSRL